MESSGEVTKVPKMPKMSRGQNYWMGGMDRMIRMLGKHKIFPLSFFAPSRLCENLFGSV